MSHSLRSKEAVDAAMAARRHPDTLNQDSKQHFFYHRFTISTSSRRGYPDPRIAEEDLAPKLNENEELKLKLEAAESAAINQQASKSTEQHRV
ncbi:hypothetical protein FOQG_00076 [Fusarium oxysporum f. sp. raphani 54005]|uniref:Uncharacterized protein n=1 Tax=Fusarium oxysporum f. sp. raphani 54005 TaxID=1089458 RepID=X0D7R1_FUSOX|nr:hypothetical protein FOQG_00076 [Fusarium oxysporum f. sp. raphani 54005]